MILKSELNAKNDITATGALVVPLLRYSFGIMNWRLEEMRKLKLNRKTGKILTMYKMHHPTAYTGCPRRKVPDFGRVFLMLKYTDITQNTYVQS
jgi:hypothetical protein